MNPAKPPADGPLMRQQRWLDDYRFGLRVGQLGTVSAVGDGIAWISGLPSAAMEDVLLFDDGSRAMVFDLNEAMIGAILLQETEALTAGTGVQCTGRTLEVPVGDALLGAGGPLAGRRLTDLLDAGQQESFDAWLRARHAGSEREGTLYSFW